MRAVLGLLGVWGICGCAAVKAFTGPSESEVLRSYIGKDIREYMLEYGTPSDTFTLADGRKTCQWKKVSVTTAGEVGSLSGIESTESTKITTLYTMYDSTKAAWVVVGYKEPTWN